MRGYALSYIISTDLTDTFKTISAPSEAILTEKRSKFLAFAYPISSEEDAKNYIVQLKKRFYDARHVCFAYALGNEATLTRTNDDGEPSGTAGRPILGQIRSFDLTNTLVAVVRYFGGIKLGTGGLAVAYKQAAFEALSVATIKECIVQSFIKVAVPYTEVDLLQRLMRPTGAEIIERAYDVTQMLLTISVKQSKFEDLRNTISKIYTAKIINE